MPTSRPIPSGRHPWPLAVVVMIMTAMLTPLVPAAAHATVPTRAELIRAAMADHSPRGELLVAAHRGQWREFPENSLDAIDAAIVDGADLVEIDIQLTADGIPVLMHDSTVDRTTDGRGAVSSFTLAEIRELRLKEGLGGAAAAVTDHRVPTLVEVLPVIRDRALINLDKGWPFREQILAVLEAEDMVGYGLFKGSPDVAQAEAFMARDPEILYMHIVGDATAEQAFGFTERQPIAIEVTFDSADDPQAQTAYLQRLSRITRVWINTLWESLAAGNTDETSLREDPDLGWRTVVERYHASIIQTDNVEALTYWRERGSVRYWDRQRGARTVRIQAEHPIPGGEGVAFHDIDANRCAAVSPEQDRLDVCSQRGARVLGWIRGGEWVRYRTEVLQPGWYEVSARVSSPYTPAGTVDVSWDDGPATRFAVPNTTDHNALRRVPVERRWFDRAEHTLQISMPADTYQNFNLDYVQLDWTAPRR